MKRKFKIACKRTCVIVLGLAMICMFCSCAFSGDNTDDKNNSGAADDSSAIGMENKYSEESNDQTQEYVDVSNDQEQASSNVSNEQSDNSSNEKEEQLPLSGEESYKAVLLNNGDFISTDLQNRKLNLKDIKEVVTDDESISVAATKFAIVDLGRTGENEVVLWTG